MYFVVPDGIDDPARPSGGNTYDRQLCRELGAHGWSVHERPVAGFWDRPDAASFAALEGTLRGIPDDAVVLLDGLIASTAPEVLVPQASRLRLVVLVHMPLGHRPPDEAARRRERAVLTAATATVTTSAWSPAPADRALRAARATGCKSPSPASRPPSRRAGARPAKRCSASAR